MPNTSAPHNPMQAVVDDAVAALQALLGLLRDETERLKTRNIDGLDVLLARKLETVQELERLEGARQDLILKAGFGADATGMESYLAQAASPALRGSWKQLKDLLHKVQAHNEANGNVIQRSLGQVESQLALLRGEQPGSNGGVYGPGGSTRSKSPGREITRA